MSFTNGYYFTFTRHHGNQVLILLGPGDINRTAEHNFDLLRHHRPAGCITIVKHSSTAPPQGNRYTRQIWTRSVDWRG